MDYTVSVRSGGSMTGPRETAEGDLSRLRLEGLQHLNVLRSGRATERDEIEFLAWRQQSRAHEEALRSAVHLQRLVRHAETAFEETAPAHGPANDHPNDPANDNVAPDIGRRSGINRRVFFGGAIAASLTGLALVGRELDLIPSPAEMTADYRTATGERRLVHLAQGASVDLNTRTAISLLPGKPEPTVELLSGEVAMASGRGEDDRVALVARGGTSIGRRARFNVRLIASEVCVTCLSGEVTIAHQALGQPVTLAAQQQLRYGDDATGKIVRVDSNQVAAWRTGTLFFRGMAMRDVVTEINRYRPGRVVLANAALADRPLTGTYYVGRLDDFFRQAELAFGLHATHLPGQIVILT